MRLPIKAGYHQRPVGHSPAAVSARVIIARGAANWRKVRPGARKGNGCATTYLLLYVLMCNGLRNVKGRLIVRLEPGVQFLRVGIRFEVPLGRRLNTFQRLPPVARVQLDLRAQRPEEGSTRTLLIPPLRNQALDTAHALKLSAL